MKNILSVCFLISITACGGATIVVDADTSAESSTSTDTTTDSDTSDDTDDSTATDSDTSTTSSTSTSSESTTSTSSSSSSTSTSTTSSTSSSSTGTTSTTTATSSSSTSTTSTSTSTSSTSSSTTSTSTATSSSSTSTTSTSTSTATSTGCSVGSSFPYSTTGTDIDSLLDAAFEPSGAVWHTRLDKLLVVGDEGTLVVMSDDGLSVTEYTIGGDLEGVTIADVDSDFVYVGVENPDGIKEFNLSTGLVTRTFTLTTYMTGPDNAGLEALTFVPDSSSSEGGSFYAGHQNEGAIYIFSLPIVTSTTSTSVTYVDDFTPHASRTDIAGLHYDDDADRLYVLYDANNKIRILDSDQNYVAEWTAPGSDQEGFTLGESCEIYIAQDSGGVIKYE